MSVFGESSCGLSQIKAIRSKSSAVTSTSRRIELRINDFQVWACRQMDKHSLHYMFTLKLHVSAITIWLNQSGVVALDTWNKQRELKWAEV